MKKMTNENLTTTPSMQEQVAMLGEYLDQHYEFRRNVLSDKFEVRNREEGATFRPITREVGSSGTNKVNQGVDPVIHL